MAKFGKRIGLTPTRAGWVQRVYYVCYRCPAELEESQLSAHECEGN